MKTEKKICRIFCLQRTQVKAKQATYKRDSKLSNLMIISIVWLTLLTTKKKKNVRSITSTRPRSNKSVLNQKFYKVKLSKNHQETRYLSNIFSGSKCFFPIKYTVKKY